MERIVYWSIVDVVEATARVRIWRKADHSDALTIRLRSSQNEDALRHAVEEIMGLKKFKLVYWEMQ